MTFFKYKYVGLAVVETTSASACGSAKLSELITSYALCELVALTKSNLRTPPEPVKDNVSETVKDKAPEVISVL